MAIILDNLLERLLNHFGLNATEQLIVTIAIGLLVFIFSYYTFPKNKKRTFDVISVKAMTILWCVIGLSVIIFFQFSHQYTVIALSSIIVSWFVYILFFGKEVWVGLSKMKHQPGYSDSMVLLSSLFVASVIVIVNILILMLILFGFV